MERRFKLLIVSKHDITNAGDNFKMVLDDSLAEAIPGTKILSTHDDYLTGSMAVLVYNPGWEEAPEGMELERIGIEIKQSVIERI